MRVVDQDKDEFVSQFAEVVAQVVFADIIVIDSTTSDSAQAEAEAELRKAFNNLADNQKRACQMLATGLFNALLDRYYSVHEQLFECYFFI